MSSQPLPEARPAIQTFRDGLGDRFVTTDRTSGERLEVLRLRAEFMKVPAFEFAVRERTARLANFRHPSFARVRRVDRLPEPSGRLAIVSEMAEGARLSDVLAAAERQDLSLDINAALCLLRQLVPAVALLHQNAREVAHGALAAERVVVTPQARVIVVEHVLGSALEQLRLSRDTLWRELRIAVPPAAGLPSFDHRADVTQIGAIALALLLGRPLRADEYPARIQALLDEATELSVLGDRQPVSPALRQWLTRALQLDLRSSFPSAREALQGLEQLLSDENGYVAAPVALEAFLARFQHSEVPDALREERESALEAAADAHRTGAAAAARPAVRGEEPDLRALDEAIGAAGAAPAAPAPAERARTPATLPLREKTEEKKEGEREPEQAGTADTIWRATPGRMFVAPEDSRDEDAEAEDTPFQDEEEEALPAPRAPRRWRRAAVAVLALLALAQGVLVATRSYRSGAAPIAVAGAATSTLVVETTPAGAQVFIDGVERGVTPLTLTVEPGARILELRGRGTPRVIPMTLEGGQLVRQHVELPVAESAGSLQVRTDPPGARVTIDEVTYGESPLTIADLAPGARRVVLESPSGRVEQVVTIEAGVTASLVVPLIQAAGPVSGWLSVGAPFEMLVYRDGALIGTSGNDRIMLPAGRHEIQIVNDSLGYREVRTVQVSGGRVTSIPIELPSGRIHLNAQPWAEVWLDGRPLGETPIGNLEVPIGPHEIVFRHPELGERRHATIVRQDEPAYVSVDMRR